MAKPRIKHTDAPTQAEPRSRIEWLGLILCGLWLGIGLFGAFSYGLFSDDIPALAQAMAGLAIALPVVLIVMVISAVRQQRLIRIEANALRSSLINLQNSLVSEKKARRETVVQAEAQEGPTLPPNIPFRSTRRTRQPLRISEPAPKIETPKPATPHEPTAEQESSLLQAQMPLDETNKAASLTVETLITAFHFPSDENDKAGFEALKLVLGDRRYRPLVHSAQAVLTRLSQDQIFMDTINVDRARPEVWRRFAEGERGPSTSTVGGVRDRTPLAVASAALRSEPNFRDVAHQFVAKFNTMLEEVAPRLSDEELVKFTNTRSAVAFMLLGRVLGMFS